MISRRQGAAALAAAAGLAWLAPRTASAQAVADFWFDPTQLPTFTGRVDRYLVNPAGETDALLFREGPQVVFPPEFAEAVRRAAPQGQPLVVWGIRARRSPVITTLAFAATAETTPEVVDRFYWRLGGAPGERAERLTVSGTVRAPYYAPQGQVAGAVLEDGTVVLLPPGAAEPFRDRLRAGASLAAEGRGFAGEQGRALIAETLGESAEALRPVAAADNSRNPAPAPEAPRRQN
ncbi:hypothetical protein ACVFYP_07330 [Roseomonas sp. F4]